jgi:hypothetical protein
MSSEKIILANLQEVVDIESSLRPVSTVGYHKGWQAEPYDFPKMYNVSPTFPVMLFNPPSSYTDDRNKRFAERYANIKNT